MPSRRRGMPVASLYQYFADKEAVLLALVERDIAELERAGRRGPGALTALSVRSLVEATMRAFVKVYHRRPPFVVIWFRGRTNPPSRDYCREHNRRMALDLFHVARSAGMVVEGSDGLYAELAVEVADRCCRSRSRTRSPVTSTSSTRASRWSRPTSRRTRPRTASPVGRKPERGPSAVQNLR